MMILKTTDIRKIKSVFDLDVNVAHVYFLIYGNTDIIGLFELQPITKISGILHMHIKKEFQNHGHAIKAFEQLLVELKTSPYKQLIGTIPVTNTKILSVVNKTKARCCGLLKNAIIYNNQLQDMFLFELEVV